MKKSLLGLNACIFLLATFSFTQHRSLIRSDTEQQESHVSVINVKKIESKSKSKLRMANVDDGINYVSHNESKKINDVKVEHADKSAKESISSSSILGGQQFRESGHTENKIRDNSPKPRNTRFFHLEPQNFIKEFVACIRDPECQVFYHHIQKASGTYIGSRLFPWMNLKFPNPMQSELLEKQNATGRSIRMNITEWCCHEPLMKRLQQNEEKFCRYKFSPWEVNSKQMSNILDICFYQKASNESKTNPSDHRILRQNEVPFTRAAILVAYREPINRTVSLVHQICNEPKESSFRDQVLRGNWNTLNFNKNITAIQEVSEACQRCSYNHNTEGHHFYKDDAEIWNHLVNDTNNMLAGIGDLIQFIDEREDSMNDLRKRSVLPFIMDVKYVSSFFQMLNQQFSQLQLPYGAKNSEKPFRVCKFDITLAPEMRKGLASGESLYQKLTTGFKP